MKLKDEADARENADINELANRMSVAVEEVRRMNLAFPSAPPDAALGSGGGSRGGALSSSSTANAWRGALGKPPARVTYLLQCTQLVAEYLPHVTKLADAYLTGKLFAREVRLSRSTSITDQTFCTTATDTLYSLLFDRFLLLLLLLYAG